MFAFFYDKAFRSMIKDFNAISIYKPGSQNVWRFAVYHSIWFKAFVWK